MILWIFPSKIATSYLQSIDIFVTVVTKAGFLIINL